jgi:chromate reductase, NAD(P)H dehydrogenase (quinone)
MNQRLDSGPPDERFGKISVVRTIVTIIGSSQPSSFTGKALAVVNDELSRLGLNVTTFDGGTLRLDFPGRPATEDGKRLRAAVRDAAGVVLSTPEYHGGMSAMIKLAIENMGFPSALQGKPVAVLGVAAGRIGAVKSVEQLRSVCGHVGALVVPNAISIANVQEAFDASGRVTDSATEESLRGLARSLESFMRDYVCPKFVLEAAVREGAVAPPWTATV